MKKIISIDGMHCKHCAASVSGALSEISGVKSVKINLKKKTATVDIGKNTVSEEALKAAVADAGFTFIAVCDKKTWF